MRDNYSEIIEMRTEVMEQFSEIYHQIAEQGNNMANLQRVVLTLLHSCQQMHQIICLLVPPVPLNKTMKFFFLVVIIPRKRKCCTCGQIFYQKNGSVMEEYVRVIQCFECYFAEFKKKHYYK